MTDTTVLELVSPSALLKSEPVEMVVVPGTDGNFGVLPKHSPMISTICPGVIDIYAGGKVSERIFVAGGVARLTPSVAPFWPKKRFRFPISRPMKPRHVLRPRRRT